MFVSGLVVAVLFVDVGTGGRGQSGREVEWVAVGGAGEAAGGAEAEDFVAVLLVEDLAYRVADRGWGWEAGGRGGLGGVEGGEGVEGAVGDVLVKLHG